LTTAYGLTSIAAQSPVNGTTLTSVSVGIPGLTSGQTYHYRVKAESSGGTAFGGDMLFTTTVNDNDGNVYNTITIGTQVWMKENLKTTKYSDETVIPLVAEGAAWAALSTPGYCWYNNDATLYKNTYGALYNWYTLNTGKLCPMGWHVPTDTEWKTLEMNLGMTQTQADAENFRGTDQGNQLKEAGTTHWLSPSAGTNSSGFTALPAGYRYEIDGSFNYGDGIHQGSWGYWWSSTEYDTGRAWNRYLGHVYSTVYRTWDDKREGIAVRCLRD
jgi:uncharacterized protein (TIGR02145 family)